MAKPASVAAGNTQTTQAPAAANTQAPSPSPAQAPNVPPAPATPADTALRQNDARSAEPTSVAAIPPATAKPPADTPVLASNEQAARAARIESAAARIAVSNAGKKRQQIAKAGASHEAVEH